MTGINPSGSYSFLDIPKAEFSDGIICSKSIQESAANIFNVLFKQNGVILQQGDCNSGGEKNVILIKRNIKITTITIRKTRKATSV